MNQGRKLLSDLRQLYHVGSTEKNHKTLKKVTGPQDNILQGIRMLLIQHIVFNVASFKQAHI